MKYNLLILRVVEKMENLKKGLATRFRTNKVSIYDEMEFNGRVLRKFLACRNDLEMYRYLCSVHVQVPQKGKTDYSRNGEADKKLRRTYPF